jgi:hypothetical protein
MKYLSNPIKVIFSIELNSFVFCYIDIELKQLFHPTTKWQQIDLWLKTIKICPQTYSFYDREQQLILDENQTISFASTIIDGVNNEDIIDVNLSYESNTKTIRILKSSPISDFLYKQYYLQQLNVQKYLHMIIFLYE